MAPTEASILTSFLLRPAPLPVAISLEQFISLFPRNVRDSENIPVLYDSLVQQVADGISEVEANINAEVERGKKQQRQVIRSRRKMHQANMRDLDLQEIQMEIEMQDGQPNKEPISAPLSLTALEAAMETACEDLEQDIRVLEEATASTLNDIRGTVDGLSDLRYGKFPTIPGSEETAPDRLIAQLQRLQEVTEEQKK